ncbi:MAG: hypothetical protein JXB50_00255 [Spirochaetes bacterium]|nr:hypothetical protein [Spirochaetota bacterium]
MKKVFFVLFLIQVLIFIYSNEDVSTDKNYQEIKKEYGMGYCKGDQYLKTKDDFIKALSPIPHSKELYLKSQRWRTAAFALLGTSIGTFVSFDIMASLTLIFGDSISFPTLYNPLLGFSFGLTALSLFAILIPQVIIMIVSFVKAYKIKKEALILYNKKVRELKEKTGAIFYLSPFVAIDKDKSRYTGIVFSLRFN